ncbi:Uncharacterized membrane protein YckC, RDD family [Pelagirhabdus alkalitolerans]|uniref:Uncharacterized membrane protein YckC, RDD family n=1 Tax=Pelagirhabdus alkalitolerans TaxID=1612202 RepID=A0A1G6H5Y5_9BACI|nr:RDD family protein [Pelagirhabdus alkalitolerans]SDB89563.1 Uncharacterized membrane protein YckC, RDD family [Pelagirhabdus alkalitolerans]
MNHYASFSKRFLARFLDFNILAISLGLLYFVFTGNTLFEWRSTMTLDAIYVVYSVVIPVLWSGYVIGKRMYRVKLKTKHNEDVKLTHTFLREVIGLQLIGAVTLGISWIVSMFMIIFRQDKRAIHDLIGGTYVTES